MVCCSQVVCFLLEFMFVLIRSQFRQFRSNFFDVQVYKISPIFTEMKTIGEIELHVVKSCRSQAQHSIKIRNFRYLKITIILGYIFLICLTRK